MKESGYAYLCSAGETFDSIALAVYGNEKYAAELLSFNPELCEKMVFVGGETLILPVIDISENEADAESAPWKE